MSKKTKVAIIGVGGISEVHIAGYKANPDVELYAFCDINEKRLKEKGAKHGITRLFTDEAEMLKALPEIEAVSVCTWNAAHAPCAIMALNAGKHVLCEKPMALNSKQALEMKAAAEKNGKVLMIGFMRRFGTNMRVLKDFVDAGDFGDIYYAKARYIRRNGAPGGWFGDKSRSGGGPLIDLGVHIIDMVRYIMGKPQPVSVYGATYDKLKNRPDIKKLHAGYTASDAGTDKPKFDVEDMATALIRFDNGAVLHIEVSFSLNIPQDDEENVEIYGDKAGAVLFPNLTIYTQQNNYLTNVTLAQGVPHEFHSMFEIETAHFIKCVRDGIECINPAEDGVALMKILDAVYESARTGHEVIIK
ncbi:MAG: Gfo/Idh/MocA family oxidoreductase [Abditibacteriota bacterium]|nr:Gfo/Idh/MocA family oxidoreductase [Abditibacteriota bacterium]